MKKKIGQKRIVGQKELSIKQFSVEKTFGGKWKNFSVKKNFSQKNFQSKKFLGKKIFGQKKFC